MTLTQEQVGSALANLGNYRVKRVQTVANQGGADGISGSLLLSLGLRETYLKNIEGGAKKDASGKWVALDPNIPADASKMDVGWLQINRGYHHEALLRMPAVKTRTWGPVVDGKSPAEGGYVPRFEEALQFTIVSMHEAIAFAEDHDVKDTVRFAVAAHNAGMGGALNGLQNHGDVDYYTALGNYSAWVIAHRTLVNRWLGQHPNWQVPAGS